MSKKLIDDFGEKIGGARKDTWRHRGLTVSDLDYMNLKECAEYVTKDNIWPLRDWKEYKDKMEPVCILHMKYVREKLPAKIAFKSDEADRRRAEFYVSLIRYMKECCENVTREHQIGEMHIKYKEFMEEKSKDYGVYMDYGLYNSLRFYKSDVEDLKDECVIQNFPDEYRGIIKGIRVVKAFSGFKLCNKSKYFTRETFSTKEEAIKYAKEKLIAELEEQKGTKKKSEIVTVVRPQLEHVERVGPNVRNNVDATPDNMLEVFDFRGGEFGNWNTQDDRQACLNYAFDAFIDLSYAMNMPLSFIGLGLKKDRQKKDNEKK